MSRPDRSQRRGDPPLTRRQLDDLPASVDPETACRVLNISRSKGYDLIRSGAFPCRVVRIGATYRIPTVELLAVLGIPSAAGGDAA